jgi:hypothetical protein
MSKLPIDTKDSPYFTEMLQLMAKAQVRHAVVGGWAVMSHSGKMRPTKDLDIYVAATEDNLRKVARVMGAMGAPDNLLTPDALRPAPDAALHGVTFGRAPHRFDIMTKMPVPFDDVEREMRTFELDDLDVPVVGKDHLIELKRHAVAQDPTRAKQDRDDIEALEQHTRSRSR